MKKTLFVIAALAIIAAVNTSCKKAGTDGQTEVVAYVKHHELVIKNHVGYPDTVYVEFNATQPPSDGKYDTYFVGEVGEDHTHCPNLHTGNYYFFGVGMDTTINQRVTGGCAVKIKYKNRKGEMDQDVPVSE